MRYEHTKRAFDRTTVCATVLAVVMFPSIGTALPPLGITIVDPTATEGARFNIFGDVAYLSTGGGVWTVDGDGDTRFIQLSHPTLGTPEKTTIAPSVTRVIRATDGRFYAAGNYPGSFFEEGRTFFAALFDIADPESPRVTWEYAHDVFDVCRRFRRFGRIGR